MTEIKRPNYFTYQFLVEQDFDDEQAYHRQMRLRHNRLLHSPGVADGMQVTRVSANQVSVAAGTAIDLTGREIALENAQVYQLATGGNNADVYLSIAYQEALDPADQYTQGSVNNFTRVTERPHLADGSVPPPSDSPVVLLAKIHLNAQGNIESDGSIDMTVRKPVSAKVVVQNANAITAVTDPLTRKVTIGETHSARTDNPHGTTAQQLDTLGGANRIVAQINAGTGTIANARLEQDMTTGVCTFNNLVPNQEQFSNEIDPGLGAGPVRVDFAFEDLFATNFTVVSDTNYARPFIVRTEVNRTTGRFSVVATRTSGAAGPARIRWYAFKVRQTSDVSVNVGVTVSPPAPTIAGNVTQLLTATVSNAFPPNVTWAGPETNGGSLSSITATSAVYTSPGVSGTYHVTATSVTDPSKSVTVAIVVNAAVTVILSQTSASIFTNGTLAVTGDVINTTNKGINWSLSPASGSGTLSATTGASVTYTPPTVPGTYSIVATSAVDSTKTSSCAVTVSAVGVSAGADATSIFTNGVSHLTATVTPATASPNANWTTTGGTVLPATGTTTTFTPPTTPGTYTITAASVTDTSKKATVNVTVAAVGIAAAAANSNILTTQTTTVSATVTPATASPNANWSTNGGSVSPATGTSTTFTPPNTGGTFTISATSVTDPSKTATANITVNAIGIAANATSTSLSAGASTTVTATVSPGFADQRANWSIASGAGSLSTFGPSNSTTYSAPNAATTATIRATSVADPSKQANVSISVSAPTGPGGPPGGPPGPGKAGPTMEGAISEEIMQNSSLSHDSTATAAAKESSTKPQTRASVESQAKDSRAGKLSLSKPATHKAPEPHGKKRTFIRPHKRPKGKLPK